MKTLPRILEDMLCVSCGRAWLGSYWGVAECNKCRGEFTSFDEPDGENPDDEDESKVDIDDEDLHEHE